MINERRRLPGRRKWTEPLLCGAEIPNALPALSRQDTMTSGITAFMVAVGGTSLACYLLMNRAQNRKSRRESAGGDSYSGPSASDGSGGNSWNPLSWFSSDSSSSHDSGWSSDFGGDGGGSGGDSGGGGGDGGGGGGGD
jgi:hypothetical protein